MPRSAPKPSGDPTSLEKEDQRRAQPIDAPPYRTRRAPFRPKPMPKKVDMAIIDAEIEDRWKTLDSLMKEIEEKHADIQSMVRQRRPPLSACETPTTLWVLVSAQLCTIATLNAVRRDAAIQEGAV